MPEHRRAAGKRYPLASLLLIAVAALLSGRRDQSGIVRWGRRLCPEAFLSIGITVRTNEMYGFERLRDKSRPA